MADKLTWEEILKRDNIVGGDIETHEDGDTYRGPIESIEIKSGNVIIEGQWMARLKGGTAEWENWHIKK